MNLPPTEWTALFSAPKITDRFHTYFHYTITAYGKDIEPGVPSIEESMQTLIELSKLAGKQRVAWRYDPVLLTEKYTVSRHIETFEKMANMLAPYIDRCIFSFVEMYKKLEINMPELIPLSAQDMEELAQGLGSIAEKTGFISRPAEPTETIPATAFMLPAA